MVWWVAKVLLVSQLAVTADNGQASPLLVLEHLPHRRMFLRMIVTSTSKFFSLVLRFVCPVSQSYIRSRDACKQPYLMASQASRSCILAKSYLCVHASHSPLHQSDVLSDGSEMIYIFLRIQHCTGAETELPTLVYEAVWSGLRRFLSEKALLLVFKFAFQQDY